MLRPCQLVSLLGTVFLLLGEVSYLVIYISKAGILISPMRRIFSWSQLTNHIDYSEQAEQKQPISWQTKLLCSSDVKLANQIMILATFKVFSAGSSAPTSALHIEEEKKIVSDLFHWEYITQVRGLGDAVYAVNCGGEAHTDLFGIKVSQTLPSWFNAA